jgi:hypothetical protein
LDLLILSVQSVNRNNTIRLVWEESRCIVNIDDSAATEDLAVLGSVNGNLLVLPSVQVLGRGMPPMLITCDRCRGIIYYLC